MSNEEWTSWQAAWQATPATLPRVVDRAKQDRARLIFGTVVFGALMAWQLVSLVRRLAGPLAPLLIAGTVLELASTIGLVVVFLVALRGSYARERGDFVQLLDALERRHAGRQRLMRWFFFITFPAFVLADAAQALSGGLTRDALLHLVGRTLVLVAIVALVFIRMRGKIARDLAEARVVRSLLSEEA